MGDMYHRVFIYSAQQESDLKKIHNTNGNKYHLGTVVVNGSEKRYTAMVRNRDEIQYADARVLIEGDIRHIKHTSPSA